MQKKTRSNFYINESELNILRRLKAKTGLSHSIMIRLAIALIEKKFNRQGFLNIAE